MPSLYYFLRRTPIRKKNPRFVSSWILIGTLLAAAGLVVSGCGTRDTAATRPAPAIALTVLTVQAICAPPAGWTAEPLKKSDSHYHQIWLSPTKKTAYGVIYFSLPFPVGPQMALWGFMREMKKSEGQGILLNQRDDGDELRFEAEGGLYHLWSRLHVQGWKGWAIYAGVVRKEPPVPDELKQAEEARDRTRIIP